MLRHAALAIEEMPESEGRAWLSRYLDAKLLSARSEALKPALRASMPALLWRCALSDNDRRRAASATYVAWLRAVDAPGMPPFGALLGTACAQRAAAALDAVAVDLATRRTLDAGDVVPSDPYAFPAEELVSVRVRSDRDRRIAAHTAGLSRMGLPELEVRGAPAAVREAARRLLLAVAQRLHALLLERGASERNVPRKLVVPLPLEARAEDLTSAVRLRGAPCAPALPVGLERGLPQLLGRRLLVVPPAGAGQTVTAWLYGPALEFLCPEGVPGLATGGKAMTT